MRGTDYTELLSFVAVAQALSFRQASRQLGLSPSALSHTIRSLEDRLQVKLLNRTTRSVSMTEAGAILLERIAPAFGEINSAVVAVQALHEHPSGVVRMNVPSAAAHIILAPLLARFSGAYPEIRLDVTIEDSLVDIVEGGFDVGIRTGERLQRDMVAIRLTSEIGIAIVCAPGYLAGRRAPAMPRELGEHACLMYRWKDSRQVYPWRLRRAGESVDIQFDAAISSNDLGLILTCCINGGGITCLPRDLVAPYLARGELVSLLEDWCEPFPGFFLYYPSRQTSAAVRAFIDFMRESVEGSQAVAPDR